MPYDEDTKVFDVAKPSKSYPDASAKPVIVGHRPQMNDPMVKDDTALPPTASKPPSTPIHVSMADEDPSATVIHPTAHTSAPSIEPETPKDFPEHLSEGDYEQHHEIDHIPLQHEPLDNGHDHEATSNNEVPSHPDSSPEPHEHQEEHHDDSNFTQVHDLISEHGVDPEHYSEHPAGNTHEYHHGHGEDDVEPLAIPAGAGPRKRWPKFIGVLLLLALLAFVVWFLAIDTGLVKSDTKLPFHIFNKQKTSKSAVSPSPSPAPALVTPPPAPAAPDGFTAYKLVGTNISFAYPNTWGDLAVTKDPGFIKRDASNKSDGTHAYMVNFATNKDVQLAFTSSKYLPPARGAQYYDFLQWCVGTNDNRLYKQTLHFTTANKADTPSTITCDQGPLTDATKIDNSTIVQVGTKDAGGKAIGDLYTENLDDKEFTVVRAKDATSKNSDYIKTLLGTVKSTSNSTSTTP
jgi:hypothetical protein